KTNDDTPVDEPQPNDAQSCLLGPASYDQSCVQDTDCVAAAFGDVCTDGCHFTCDLGGTAINAKDSSRYNAALAVAVAQISEPQPNCLCGSGMGAGFEGSAAFCKAEQCVGGYRPS